MGTFRQGKSRKVAKAIVTAGLMCPPDMPLETHTPRAVPVNHKSKFLLQNVECTIQILPTAQPKLIDK